MSEIVWVQIYAAQKSVFIIIVKMNRFGRTPKTALSIESDCEPLEM